MWWFRSLLPKRLPGFPTPARRTSVSSMRRTTQAKVQLKTLNWVLYLLVTAVLVTVQLVAFRTETRIDDDYPAEGEITDRDIVAPFSFTAPLLDQDIEMLQLQKVLVEPPVVRLLPGKSLEVLRDVRDLFDAFLHHASLVDIPLEERIGLMEIRFPELPSSDIRRGFAPDVTAGLFANVVEVLSGLYENGIVDNLPPGNYRTVRIMGGKSEVTVDASSTVEQGDLSDVMIEELVALDVSHEIASWVVRLVRPMIVPDLIYSPEETRARRMEARESVPREREFIKGERIIAKGERVSELAALFIESLVEETNTRGETGPRGPVALNLLVKIVLMAGILFFFGWLTRINFPGLLVDGRSLSAVAVILAVFIFAAAYCLRHPVLGPYALPIHWLAVLVTTLYRDRIGYNVTLLGVAMIAIQPMISAWWLLCWLIEGVLAVTLVRRIRNRDQFYKAITVLAVLSVVLITIFEYLSGGMTLQIWKLYLVGILTPVVSVAAALFLLPIIEPLVGACSDLTLLELADLNHPLLRKMSLESQGTFHHSLIVSQMAEHGAAAIGANSLLARVGGLFHDMGKMAKPEYYVENQGGGPNKHDELSPSMSALVVASHVKDGIDMARRWRLPQDVIDAIPEHHGTQVMKFFYHKALESAGNETVKVDDFRYPGPKPRRRETGILMLADAIEAATRSLAKPTIGRIRDVTRQITEERMLSGELDDCGLSMKDLSNVREAFIPLLTGIHHARITYPGQPGFGASTPQGEGA